MYSFKIFIIKGPRYGNTKLCGPDIIIKISYYSKDKCRENDRERERDKGIERQRESDRKTDTKTKRYR